MPITLPISMTANITRIDEEELILTVRSAIEQAVGDVGLPSVEVHYDANDQHFLLMRFVEVAEEGDARRGALPLKAAREVAPEVMPGEELGFDLFDLDDDFVAQLGVPPDVRRRACRVAFQAARGALVRAREDVERKRARARVGRRLEAAPFPSMRRPCFEPVVAVGDELQGSQYGGDPILLENEAWPPCPACGIPLELILQLATEALPAPTGLAGHLQFFWCTNLEADCAGQTSAFSGVEGSSGLLRLVQGATRAPRDAERPAETPTRARITPRQITGWAREDELPHLAMVDQTLLEERGIHGEDYHILTPFGGDKLLGFPRWIQGGGPMPRCRACEEPTRLLYQLASDSYAEICWGDLGRVYILGCEREPGHLQFFIEMS